MFASIPFEDFILDQKKCEENIPYESLLPDHVKFKTYEEKLNEAFNNGKRSDGRTSQKSRKIHIELGSIAEASGSCYFEVGETRVICGVSGPREIHFNQGQGCTELGSIDCIVESQPPSVSDKAYSDALKRALEPTLCRHEFPNLEISVSVLILNNNGSALAATINAACLALAHARLPIFDILTCVTIGIHGDLLFIDPTDKEEELCMTLQKDSLSQSHGLITICYMTTADQIAYYHQSGEMNLNQMVDSMGIGINRCKLIYSLCKHEIKQEFETKFNNKKQLINIETKNNNMMQLTNIDD